MLVLLDATVFVSDPLCASTAWRILAQAHSAWGVEIFVPTVVVRESVGGYRRLIADASTGLKRWGDKHVGRLPLADLYERASADLNAVADSYEDALVHILSSLPATILPYPEVAHSELVERAVARRRPCNGNGDGYRDTLNWFTLLQLVGANPDAFVIWVSNNSRDFGGADEAELHESLRSELRDVGAEDRIKWVPDLSDAVLLLAAAHSSESGADLPAIQRQLEDQALRHYVQQLVTDGVERTVIAPRLVGLPLESRTATVLRAEEFSDWRFAARASLEAGRAVVEFTVEALATVAYEALGDPPDEPEYFATVTGPGEFTASLQKRLTFAGILEVDKFRRPTDGQLTRVYAAPDDPGVLRWNALRSLGNSDALRMAMQNIDLPGDAMRKAMQNMNFSGDAIRKAMQEWERQQRAAHRDDVPNDPPEDQPDTGSDGEQGGSSEDDQTGETED